MSWWCIAILLTPQVIDFEDVAYKKLATRKETERRMLSLLLPRPAEFGDFHLLSPFPYAGHGKGDLKTPLAPEAELAKMRPAATGPDLSAQYEGKNGVIATWQPLGEISNRAVQLAIHRDSNLNNDASCYLYGTAIAPQAVDYPVTLGSDDGLRLWVNGRLLIDRDVPRGLDPESERLDLSLQEGVNHIFAKVSQGGGGWQFQMNTRRSLSPQNYARLRYRLDLDFAPSEEWRYYRSLTVPVPDDLVLEVGGIALLPDARPVLTTRRGEVYLVENIYEEPPFRARFQHFATGLHEPLGVAARLENGKTAVYTVQRSELTRLWDEDGDDVADFYESFCDDWGVSGNYHEFAFGPKFDHQGNAWVTLNVGFCGSLGKSPVPYRGWAVKISPEGILQPVCGGLRSPNGMAMAADGEMFYVDNQGDYVATNRLSWLGQDTWHGHPSGLAWRKDWKEGDPDPPRERAAVWFPYERMGQSVADIVLDDSGGRFGPFSGQMFVGDQTRAVVMRVFLERIGSIYQGACMPFLKGFDCGINRLAFAADGSLLVGQTDRGWGSVGRRRHGLQRVIWSGETPFEILTMRVTPKGFALQFTQDMDRTTALDPASYRMESFTYHYHSDYGSPEVDRQDRSILSVTALDARTVELILDQRLLQYVHELHCPGVRSTKGDPLLHDVAYYTLQALP